jgi:hypothetical protein
MGIEITHSPVLIYLYHTTYCGDGESAFFKIFKTFISDFIIKNTGCYLLDNSDILSTLPANTPPFSIIRESVLMFPLLLPVSVI